MLAAMSHRHKTFELWNYSQHEVFNHSSDYGLFKLHPVRRNIRGVEIKPLRDKLSQFLRLFLFRPLSF